MVPPNQAGREMAGRARTPPSVAPMMVLQEAVSAGCFKATQETAYPRHQTKGIIEYARAAKVSLPSSRRSCDKLTLVLLHGDQLRDGGLKNADVPATAFSERYCTGSHE